MVHRPLQLTVEGNPRPAQQERKRFRTGPEKETHKNGNYLGADLVCQEKGQEI
jgi:hypothetical protein